MEVRRGGRRGQAGSADKFAVCIEALAQHRILLQEAVMADAPDALEKLRQDAWIGDAVLELYVRSWVLERQGAVDAEMKTRFTCNQFLNCVGNPTRVEADIGVIYMREGMEAAFAWIRENLEPLFVRQETRRGPRRH